MQFMRWYFLRLLIILLPFALKQNIYGQTFSKDISVKEYYDFFNSFVNTDSVQQFNLESDPDFSNILKDTAEIFSDTTLFSPADIDFLKYQLKHRQIFKWQSDKIAGARIISSKKIKKFFKHGIDKGWIAFNKKYKNGFATFSIPLFTVDKNICIVYKSGRCGGLCGHGGTNVYKKVNGKWTFIQSIGNVWIS